MPPTVKCKHCDRFIVENAAGEWVLPNAKYPSPRCLDGVHVHEPHKRPDGTPIGIVAGVAIGASVSEAGLI
jgi:hypothetical protein